MAAPEGLEFSVAVGTASLNNNQVITGGLGGNGGGGGAGGNGGDGGIGVYFVSGGTLSNSGSISGGAGGAGGLALTPGLAGINGPGVEGADLTIINSGTLAGGSGNGFQANAITFSGGANTLTLQAGSRLIGNVEIDGGGSITFNQASAQTVSNAITGNGSIIQAGPGKLTFTGANTYTGDTIISGGTLQLGDGITNSVIAGNITNNATLAFEPAAGTTTTNFSVISGAGVVNQIGAGTLILNGINTYTGTTTINAGTLEIGDASQASASIAGDVTVGALGILMGHGTIGGGVTNTAGGIVAPGGTIGTLSVASYTQGANSALAIEVSPTRASKLNVTGAAALNGTLALIYDPGVYSAATFDIVHAGSISGTFATVSASGLPAGVGQSITYAGTDVDLVLTGSGSTLVVRPTNDGVFSSLGTTALLGGQQANTMLLGHLSDSHRGTGSDTIETALASTSPTRLAFSGGAMHLSDAVAQLPDTMAQLGGWFRAIGSFANLSGTSSVPGVDTQGGGFMAGLDRPIVPNLTAGIAAGYSHTNLSQHDSESGTLDTPRVALYGSYTMGLWAFDATIGYAYDRISEKRPLTGVGVASSSHDAHEATGAAQAIYHFDYAGFSVMPNAGFTYVRLFDGGLSESGANGFDLGVSHNDADSLRPFIGASASTSITTASGVRLVPEGDIRYSHELFATAPALVSVGGGNFSVNGLTPSHDLLTIGGGITAAMTDRLALFADYHATLPTGNYWQQTVTAGARYEF